MRWLLIGGLLAIAVGTSGLAEAAGVITVGGHSAMDKQMHGGMMGSMMAGAAVRYVPEEQARTAGEQAPEGAKVDRSGKLITFQTTTVHLKVLGSPEGSPDMTFRIAGLHNPTIVMPRGATVEVEFINGDRDTSHGWQLVRRQGSFSHMPMMDNQAAFPGSVGMPLGVPSSRGWPAETLSFTAADSGTYTYLCPVPGHAQKGMHGQFLVTAA